MVYEQTHIEKNRKIRVFGDHHQCTLYLRIHRQIHIDFIIKGVSSSHGCDLRCERLWIQKLDKKDYSNKRVPILGEKPLNLHQLFIEVTTKGGLERVISDRKWKEIIVVFDFPPTTTGASYALRKYYISMLRCHEQLYFFRTQGSQAPLEASLAAVATPVSPQVQPACRKKCILLVLFSLLN